MNIKYYYDFNEEHIEHNKLNVNMDNINTYTLYNKLIKVFSSTEEKYTIKYCVIEECIIE